MATYKSKKKTSPVVSNLQIFASGSFPFMGKQTDSLYYPVKGLGQTQTYFSINTDTLLNAGRIIIFSQNNNDIKSKNYLKHQTKIHKK